MKSSIDKLSNYDQIRNRDFPWLWAVRDYWAFGLNNVRVKNADSDEDFQRILSVPCRPDFGEIWIRHGILNRKRYFQLIKVERVDIPIDAKGECLATWIARAAPRGNEILNLVFVLSPLMVDETIVVYRLKRDQDFGDILNHAIHECSRRTRNIAA